MERRWCLLTDALPQALSVGGETFPIDTRTSTALNCIRKMREDVPEEAKRVYSLSRLGLPQTIEALEVAYDYLAGPPSDDEMPTIPGPPSFDYFQDAKLIGAAFQQAYGLSLDDTTSMHWWRFLSLLEGLPANTRFMEVVGIRTMEIGPKDSAEEKARKRRAKKSVALKDTRTEEEKKRDVQAGFNSLGL
ncbi:MAG: Gp15 family bacteriophage protein [Sphaerochaeta sp.]|nr:Gp15 family bacteriophage protein [Sphaerochaeta sp.]